MEESSSFQEFETKENFTRRRNLLPLWIKIFLWFFLIGGLFAAVFLIIGPFLNKIDLSLYGITATHSYTLPGIITTLLLIYKGIVAYGLWFERK